VTSRKEKQSKAKQSRQSLSLAQTAIRNIRSLQPISHLLSQPPAHIHAQTHTMNLANPTPVAVQQHDSHSERRTSYSRHDDDAGRTSYVCERCCRGVRPGSERLFGWAEPDMLT
jgi:hypothetical protein